MRMLILYILFLAFGCQQTTDNRQRTITSTLTSTLTSVAEPVEAPGDVVVPSTSSGTCTDTLNVSTYIICNKDVCDTSLRSDSVTYYKSQLLIADSLYKNYLPQYNFNEVKAAVVFFEKSSSHQVSKSPSRDNQNNSLTWRLVDSLTHSLGDSVTRRLGDLNFLSARAHYYHAVGLTERDDVVGACEHYLRALEIMELELETENLKALKLQNFKTSEPQNLGDSVTQRLGDSNYEKLRFIALTYTRLGRLFLNENYCDHAITKYKNALKYAEILGNNDSKANILKELGNSYQLANKPDSALYYYNESLRYNPSLPNRLDVEKSIAKILFYKDEKDSAYVLLKNNLREIDNGNLKYSYYYTLGDMYFNDKKYDSALYYLETSLDNDIVTKKVAFTTKLSAIYDILGDYDKRDYYDNFSAKMLLNHANKEVDNKQLQVIYDNYKERKNERERSIAKAKTRKQIIAIVLCVFVILASLSIFFKYRHQRHINKLTEDIDDYANENRQLVEDFQKVSSKKDKIIRQQKKEIEEIKIQLDKKNRVNLEAYYDSEICKKIMARKDSDFSCLKEDELALLMKSADMHLNNISTRLCEQFPTLNTNDLYTICLIILNVEKNKFPYLL
ncbi:MAG: tetratricopeptide repeat protein, partial [Bacteroidales bacterium]|nr:tetratricopeptide repeat protein [Bacteroidales bacterium]